MWESDYLPFDNAPFIVVNHRVYDCQHGVDRHLSVKKRSNTVSNNFFRVTKYLHINNIHRYNIIFMITMSTVIFLSLHYRLGITLLRELKKGTWFRNQGNLTARHKYT